MPRSARIDAPGALHHIMARGMDRQTIFRRDADREDFLRRLERLVNETGTRCFAWSLLPNHFHLLLQTGNVPLATVMRRLMTGYALGFNRRYQRHGHLFQNRYKSYLCDEAAYLLELLRYIHLNPLRAGIVANLEDLDRFPFSGHCTLMNNCRRSWQETGYVLALFHPQHAKARSQYRQFVSRGADQGRRSDLTGGGLLRSVGGWAKVRELRREGATLRSDERILGDSAFVATVLERADESLNRRYALTAEGVDFDAVLDAVSCHMALAPIQVRTPSKIRKRVQARSLVCFWAVRELGLTMTDLSLKLDQSVAAVSLAVRRGERLALESGLKLEQLVPSRTGNL